MTELDNDVEELVSVFHHALRASRRRQVVGILTENSKPMTVRSLARRVAAQEHQVPLTHATGEPYRNVYNALSQTHLPTLSEAGIVVYDPVRQTVDKGPNFLLASLIDATTRPTVALVSERYRACEWENKDGGNE